MLESTKVHYIVRMNKPFVSMTKFVAKEFGCIETLVLSGAEFQNRPTRLNKQKNDFEYLIVIDFESTCWKDTLKRRQPEIIEFPAVLLNMHTGNIEYEFHHYVKPTENTCLSEFCIQLTGIKQDDVDNGVHLEECLLHFMKWIEQLSEELNIVFHQKSNGKRTCTFMTWSDWDLSLCLHNECKRKNIKKPGILCQWIDLKHIYKVFYKCHPKGLRNSLSELGLKFVGREHSGICDARNTANLAWHMLKQGAVFMITGKLI